MTSDAKCPSCGAPVPAELVGSDSIPGHETSAVPTAVSCPECGSRLTPDAAADTPGQGGWHVDGEAQA